MTKVAFLILKNPIIPDIEEIWTDHRESTVSMAVVARAIHRGMS